MNFGRGVPMPGQPSSLKLGLEMLTWASPPHPQYPMSPLKEQQQRELQAEPWSGLNRDQDKSKLPGFQAQSSPQVPAGHDEGRRVVLLASQVTETKRVGCELRAPPQYWAYSPMSSPSPQSAQGMAREATGRALHRHPPPTPHCVGTKLT